MSVTTTSRLQRRPPRAFTAILLVIQVVGGGAVTLAHAAERSTAPVAIEAQHDARCVVLHDAVRCAVCHHAGTHVATPRTLMPAVADAVVTLSVFPSPVPPARVTEHPAAAPRAPPADSRT